MTTISCSSCSATPTPQSLVLEALSKGELVKKSGSAGEGGDSRGTKAGSADTVQISAAGYQRLQRDAAGEAVVNAVAPISPADAYNKTGLQTLPSSS